MLVAGDFIYEARVSSLKFKDMSDVVATAVPVQRRLE